MEKFQKFHDLEIPIKFKVSRNSAVFLPLPHHYSLFTNFDRLNPVDFGRICRRTMK